MLSTKTIGLIFSALLLSAGQADARARWLERDGRAVMAPRRFGQESPAVIQQIGSACAGEICGNLAGSAISTLLAAAGECTQQDKADEMITAAKKLSDPAQAANLISLAIEFRQVEKNTPPGFNTNPVTNRNSVFCQKAPINAELNGLVQAQDPANDPNLFFDPLDKTQVVKGDRPNTSPFGGAAVVVAPVAVATTTAEVAIQTVAAPAATDVAVCPAQVTVTVTAAAAAATTVAAATSVAVAAPAITAIAGGAAGIISTSTAKFGTCTNAGVQRAAGLNGRKATEVTFQPANLVDFNHGEALNPQIIFEFICDTFVNRCGGSTANVQTCKTLASTITTRDDAAALAWNAGIEKLAFSTGGAVSTIDVGGVAVAAPLTAATTPVISTSTAKFGTCSNAGVTFQAGLNNRAATEFTFLPTNQANFGQQGEALNPQIIFNFICDTFVNRCGGSTANVASCKSFATTITTRDSSAALKWNAGVEALAF